MKGLRSKLKSLIFNAFRTKTPAGCRVLEQYENYLTSRSRYFIERQGLIGRLKNCPTQSLKRERKQAIEKGRKALVRFINKELNNRS